MKLIATTIAGTKLKVLKGASLFEACHEAMLIALTRREIVRFTYRDCFYEANPNLLNALVQDSKKTITRHDTPAVSQQER